MFVRSVASPRAADAFSRAGSRTFDLFICVCACVRLPAFNCVRIETATRKFRTKYSLEGLTTHRYRSPRGIAGYIGMIEDVIDKSSSDPVY